MQGEDSGEYSSELTLFAKKIFFQYKTNSIDYSAVSIRDLIWIETAFCIDKKIEREEQKFTLDAINDLRVLIKDLDDLNRIKLTRNAKHCLKWSDLPSQSDKKKPEMDDRGRRRHSREDGP